MTSPHPLAAWLERAQAVQPHRSSAERFPELDDGPDDGLDERRRRRARTVARVRRTRSAATVSRVRYG